MEKGEEGGKTDTCVFRVRRFLAAAKRGVSSPFDPGFDEHVWTAERRAWAREDLTISKNGATWSHSEVKETRWRHQTLVNED